METFFSTFYYWTAFLYSSKLDNFLFDNDAQGYSDVGIIMLILGLLIASIYYYLVKPVRRQHFKYYLCLGINAAINFLYAMYYTATPLVNNEIDESAAWNYIDCFFFSLTDAFWSAAFFFVFSLIIKWASPAKYVPFIKF